MAFAHYLWFGMLTDLPNILTLSRIAAIPLLVALVAVNLPSTDLAACLVFGAAAITDYYDGKLARSRLQQSELGRLLDPIADKLLVGAALMMLAGQNRLSAFGLYPAIVIMLREILVSGLREYLAGIRVGLPVTRLAKWKTGFQMGALGMSPASNMPRVSTDRWLRSRQMRRSCRTRTPSVLVSVRISCSNAELSEGLQSTVRSVPGRPFFMITGVSITSSAPVASAFSAT